MSSRRSKKNRRFGLIIKFCFFLYMVIGIFALVWLKTAVLELEYRVGELQKERSSVMRERKLILAERASLHSSKKIEEFAIKSLGMSLPEREKVFFVRRIPPAGPHNVSMNFSQMSSEEHRKRQK